ncbi:carbonate dehydratase [Ferrovibrio terrae]|uniref:Carbonic anhydrase n=1 Tax=Ferrovibrio terrae TaxID=2594003 RepID=A0A516H2S8_9PROT|nr:carbonate dehydratase [Ferrovibrio terrae]QDO98078.1 carbonate dehydratase [Ferrovibrio terrae]
MADIAPLFESNRAWAISKLNADPGFFDRLTHQQTPSYLWIGCADSRVPANEIVGLDPGELFVHRNVANLVHPADMNCLAVLQYAIEYLKVKHVIVTGHYGCGGVRAAMQPQQLGLIDHWLRPIRDVYAKHEIELKDVVDEYKRLNLLCEMNVREQVANLAKTTIVQNAWHRGQDLSLHGWVYGISNGLIRDLGVTISGVEPVDRIFRTEPAQSAP